MHEISDRLCVLMEAISNGDITICKLQEACGNVISQIWCELENLLEKDDQRRFESFKRLRK